MSWVLQMLWLAVMVLGIALALWIGFWLLLGLFALGVAMVLWSHLRAFLLAKGILNPTPGVPPVFGDAAAEAKAPLIEGDFTRVDESSDRS